MMTSSYGVCVCTLVVLVLLCTDLVTGRTPTNEKHRYRRGRRFLRSPLLQSSSGSPGSLPPYTGNAPDTVNRIPIGQPSDPMPNPGAQTLSQEQLVGPFDLCRNHAITCPRHCVMTYINGCPSCSCRTDPLQATPQMEQNAHNTVYNNPHVGDAFGSPSRYNTPSYPSTHNNPPMGNAFDWMYSHETRPSNAGQHYAYTQWHPHAYGSPSGFNRPFSPSTQTNPPNGNAYANSNAHLTAGVVGTNPIPATQSGCKQPQLCPHFQNHPQPTQSKLPSVNAPGSPARNVFAPTIHNGQGVQNNGFLGGGSNKNPTQGDAHGSSLATNSGPPVGHQSQILIGTHLNAYPIIVCPASITCPAKCHVITGRDLIGCPICRCPTPAAWIPERSALDHDVISSGLLSPCPPLVTCTQRCPHGYASTSSGCPSCSCMDTSPTHDNVVQNYIMS